MSDADRRFPLLGGRGSIPWSIAEEAYAEYARLYGSTQSLERLAQRGGFAPEELDELRPGWRPVAARISALETALREADVFLSCECVVCPCGRKAQDTIRAALGKTE